MTAVVYDPKTPEMRFEGHAGAGRAGADPVCAALSILMYTLASEEAHSAPFPRENGKTAHPFPPSSFSPAKRNGFAGGREEAHSAPFPRENGKTAHPFPPSSFSPAKRNGFAGGPEEAHSAPKLCVEMADGFCRIRGGERAVYEVIVAGLRLLATEKPEHVHLEVKG